MRRKDREIKEKSEMIEVMRRCDVCRLALNDGEYPYVVPLNFGMDVKEEQVTLIFHGALEGKKYDVIAANPHATFEMDCAHRLVLDDESMSCTMEYESIIGHGVVKMLSEEEKLMALKQIMAQYHKEDFPFNEAVIPRTNVFSLRVEDMTGKRRRKNK